MVTGVPQLSQKLALTFNSLPQEWQNLTSELAIATTFFLCMGTWVFASLIAIVAN